MSGFAELLRQHAEIRVLIDHCEQLANELDCNKIEPGLLLKEVAHLRDAFEAHCRYEERCARPIIDDAHVDEHRGTAEVLGSSVTGQLRATLARLRHHLDSEDRYFLTQESSHESAG